MTWTPLDTWIALAAALTAGACSLLGTYLVLRRMSMMGDAISHAVLPGLAVAFLLTHSRAGPVMFAGAAVTGVLTALFTQWVHRFGRVDQNAAMGVVFTSLFAIGLVLIVRAADHVDLDPGCVLYGAIETITTRDTVEVLGVTIPGAIATLGIVYLIDLVVVVCLFKELAISAFDPELATTMGIPSWVMTQLLMGLVAMTAVAAFESVGSIVVIAMLIVPPAIGLLLSERLIGVMVIGQVAAVLSGVLGHAGAVIVPGWFGYDSTITSGMIAVAAGGLLVLAVLFGPRRGVVSQLRHRARLGREVLREDLLGVLYRLEGEGADASGVGVGGHARTVAELARLALVTPSRAARGLRELAHGGLVAPEGGTWSLTVAGREAASRLVRSHRLWEVYLAAEMGVRPDHVHATAHRLEHLRALDGTLEQELPVALAADPHGKPIPPP